MEHLARQVQNEADEFLRTALESGAIDRLVREARLQTDGAMSGTREKEEIDRAIRKLAQDLASRP